MLGVLSSLNSEKSSQLDSDGEQEAQRHADAESGGRQSETLGRYRSFRQVRGIDDLNTTALKILSGVSANVDLLLLSQQVVVVELLCLVLAIDRFQTDLGRRNLIDPGSKIGNLRVSFTE